MSTPSFIPFYHQLLRKYHIAFGSLFKQVTLLRNDTSNAEVQRFVLPIEYSAQEAWLSRFRRDPDLTRKDEMTVPRLAYEMISMRSDPNRQLNSLQQRTRPIPGTLGSMRRFFIGAPHILSFNLYALTRSIDDANQIIEQIVPVFAATGYTLLLKLIPSVGILDRMRIVLDDNSPQIEDNYLETAFQSKREVVLTFNFNVFATLYGAVGNTPVNIIRKVIIDLYEVPANSNLTGPIYYLTDALDRLMLESGTGLLLDEETITTFRDTARLERMIIEPNPLNAPPIKPVDTTTTIISSSMSGTRSDPYTGDDEPVGA